MGALIFGLRSSPEYNGRFGLLSDFSRGPQGSPKSKKLSSDRIASSPSDEEARWLVTLDDKEAILVLPKNLCRADLPEERAHFLGRRFLEQHPLCARALLRIFQDTDASGLRLSVASCLTPRESLMVISGFAGRIRNEVNFYRPKEQKWQRLGQMKPRIDAGAVCLPNGRILMAGGVDDHPRRGSLHKSAELLDPLTGQWSKLPDLQFARHGCAAALVGSRAYIVGGAAVELQRKRLRIQAMFSEAYATGRRVYGQEFTEIQQHLSNMEEDASVIESINVGEIERGEEVAWEQHKAPAEAALCCFPAAGGLDGWLIVAGGESDEGPTDECWGLSPSGQWKELARLPDARSAAAFCVHPRLGLVIVGGRGTYGQALASVVALKAPDAQWQELAPTSVPRLGGAATTLNGQLVAVSGSTDDPRKPFTTDVERYVEGSDCWEVVPHLEYPHALHACYAFGVWATPAD